MRTMKRTILLRNFPLSLLAFALSIATASAQTDTQRAELTLEVSGLTCAMRDGLAADLRAEGSYRIAFACVPAGIMILEPIGGQRNSNPDATIMPIVQRRAERSSVRRSTLDRNAVEVKCAEERDR